LWSFGGCPGRCEGDGSRCRSATPVPAAEAQSAGRCRQGGSGGGRIAAPKPQYGTFGFDMAGMDTSVAAGDNFYQYANGTWAKNTPIPADKSNYGSFNILDDLSRERTRGIIEEQAKEPNSRIGNAYASFMDTAAIEAKGLAPFTPWLSEVRGIKSKKD